MVLWFWSFFFQIPRTNGSLIQIFFFQIPRTSGSVIQNLFQYPESWFWFFRIPGTGTYFWKHQRTTPHWLAPFLLSFWKFSNSSKLEFFWAQNLKHLNMLRHNHNYSSNFLCWICDFHEHATMMHPCNMDESMSLL